MWYIYIYNICWALLIFILIPIPTWFLNFRLCYNMMLYHIYNYNIYIYIYICYIYTVYIYGIYIYIYIYIYIRYIYIYTVYIYIYTVYIYIYTAEGENMTLRVHVQSMILPLLLDFQYSVKWKFTNLIFCKKLVL